MADIRDIAAARRRAAGHRFVYGADVTVLRHGFARTQRTRQRRDCRAADARLLWSGAAQSSDHYRHRSAGGICLGLLRNGARAATRSARRTAARHGHRHGVSVARRTGHRDRDTDRAHLAAGEHGMAHPRLRQDIGCRRADRRAGHRCVAAGAASAIARIARTVAASRPACPVHRPGARGVLLSARAALVCVAGVAGVFVDVMDGTPAIAANSKSVFSTCHCLAADRLGADLGPALYRQQRA